IGELDLRRYLRPRISNARGPEGGPSGFSRRVGRRSIEMTKHILAAGTLLVLPLILAPASGQTPPAPRKIEILFLGHNSKHHDSAKFEPILQDALASEPFHFTYTADPKDLNDANLAKYDELIIYANHNKIAPEQEKALLDFVAGGKGFLPLHSASFCFQNSPAYVSLVGAQFQRHKTGEFVT